MISPSVLFRICRAVLAAAPAIVLFVPDSAVSQTAATGGVRGAVFDSLGMRPLQRATVHVQGTTLATITGMNGQFSFAGLPPGRHVLTFTSPTLEAAGVVAAGVPATVVAGQTTNVVLTTPSLRRMWQVLCAGRPRFSLDSGIVTGTVVDGDRNLRLKKAPTAFSWFDLKVPDKYDIYPEVRKRVETDSLGAYVACGMPTDVVIMAKSFGDDATTGEVKYFVGPHFVRRVDMIVTKALSAGLVARGTASLRGVVRDSAGRPVADAIVGAPAADTSTRSGNDGSFVLRGLAAGSQGLEVRKVGYGMATPLVSLVAGRETMTNVVMGSSTMLDTFLVRGEHKVTVREQEFMLRRKLRQGFFVDPEQTAGTNPLAALMSVPRLEFHRGRIGNSDTVYVRGASGLCVPNVFLDGVRTDMETMYNYPVDRLRAIEVFNSGLSLPAQFIVSSINQCGAVVYWSKAAW